MWKEPAYRRRQQAAEIVAERRQSAQHEENKVRAIGSINSGVDALAGEQSAARHQNWFTFGALVSTASAAILAMLVAHCDTDTTISALQTQATTMRDQLGEMRGDKRAWVSPSRLDIRQNWGAGEQPDDYVQVVVTMFNTGREPAINAYLSVHTELFDIDDVKRLGDTSALLQTTDIPLIKENDACAELHPVATGLTIYPAGPGLGTPNGLESGIRLRLWPTIYEMVTALSDNHRIMYLNGCVTYTTLSEVHHSKFCQFLAIEAGQLPLAPFKHCPVGNEAD
jgi:hypothetical protein